MVELLSSILQLLTAVWQLLLVVLWLVAPWTPLIAWVAYWLLAVDWVKLRHTLVHQGGLLGVLLIGAAAVLVWGLVAPPPSGFHRLFGLEVSNFTGKLVYVTGLCAIMFLCGSVQLSGACGTWVRFPEDAPEDDHGHGHDDHGHDAHGHGEAHAAAHH